MSQKSQKGSSVTGLLMVFIMILLAIFEIFQGLYTLKNRAAFKEIFGVVIVDDRPLDNDKIRLLEPLVTSRLKELNNNLKILTEERVALLTLSVPSPTPTPDDANKKINKLNEIKAGIDHASSVLARAKKSAEYFGFKIDTASQ